MKVALPIHRDRISPLFDTAGRAIVLEFGDGAAFTSTEVNLPGDGSPAQVESLVSAGVERLVCGAISGPLMAQLLWRGLQVWPGVAGEVKEVITSLCSRGALDGTFMMPGCGGGRRRRGRGRGFGGGGGRRWGWQAAEGPSGPWGDRRPRKRGREL